jgi:anti-sigma factor RsiW
MIDDKTLLAYADGELDPGRAADVERVLARDPVLAAKLEQHRRHAGRLRASGGAKVISLAEARAARAVKAAPARDWRAGGLIAAGLAAALMVGELLWAPHAGPVAERRGQLVASGDLGQTLDTQLSGGAQTTRIRGPTRIQLTFRDRAGAVCRSFTGAVASGVACRQDGGWALQALFPAQAPSGGDYGTATSGDPRVRRVVGDMISGDAFDAAQERAARARHWTVR